MVVDETMTNYRQLLDVIYSYFRRLEDTALCEGDYEIVPDQDEELGAFIWTLQQIYFQHTTKAEKEAEDDQEEKERK